MQLEQEEKGSTKKKRPMLFKEFYEAWLLGYRNQVKESTLRKTTEAFRLHILPEMGDYIMQNVGLAEAQAAVNLWHSKLVNFRMIKDYASAVFKAAIRQGIVERNPFQYVVMPKQKKASAAEKSEQRNFYDKDELQQFLEAVEREEDLKWYMLFRLLSFSGIRKGEALALTWKDINFKTGLLTVNKTLTIGMDNQLIVQDPKTKTGIRMVSLDKKTLAHLAEWKKEQRRLLKGFGHKIDQADQLLFTTIKNEYIPLPQPGHVIDRVCRNNNLKRITVHGLRHSHCSLLFEAGLSIKEVQDRLGHSDIQTTMNIYAHVTQKKRDEVADKFAEFVSF